MFAGSVSHVVNSDTKQNPMQAIPNQIPSGLRQLLIDIPRHVAEQMIRDSCQSTYLGDKEVLCRILCKFKFFLRSDDCGFSPHVIQDGYWEYWLTQFMARVVKPGNSVIDIGANVGYYSVLLADLVGSNGRLIAVEPNPLMFALLQKNLQVNGFAANSTSLNMAITRDVSSANTTFFVPFNEPKNGRLVFGGENVEFLRQHGDVFDVRLGALTHEDVPSVDFIKIDVEGAEMDVLDSLSDTIERHHPQIICEVNFARGYTFEEVAKRLGVDGKLFHLDFDGRIKELCPNDITTRRIGDDWLIYSGLPERIAEYIS